MNLRSFALVLVSASVSILAGCSSGGTTTSGATSGGAGAGDGGTASNGLTCSQILTCTSDPSCTTNDCIQKCIAQGSPDAQSVANALDSCYQTNACQDANCIQTKCASQLSACTSQGAGQAGGSSGGPSGQQGSVPTSFVGTWSAGDSADLGAENTFRFSADGTATYAVAETSESGCVTTTDTETDGTAVIDATTITIYPTKATTTQVICGTTSTTPESTSTLSFTYAPDTTGGGAIRVTDATCAAQYAGDTPSINLYCALTYRKQ